MSANNNFFHAPLGDSDPLVADALRDELKRQQTHIELIASENIVSRAVLDALAHPVTNKTLEGYPGKRFHGGGEYVDIVEQAAIDRACELFGCDYANVQPHSGTQANQAVFFALLKPGERVLSMNLSAGGHLSHGATANQSGQWFESHHYGVNPGSGLIDYQAAERIAIMIRPKLIIAGGSAYPREIDFERMARIANKVDALLLVDMAHIAGLVAADAHPSPVPFADVVTCTTTKTLRGPRGGLILSRDAKWGPRLQSAIFPGVQGSLHSQIIAAKAVCLGEALGDEFKDYGKRVVKNAKVLGRSLADQAVNLVSGGTDTHMLLLDLSATEWSGQQVQDSLARVNITSNKNPIPFDSIKPSEWTGLRLGVAAATTRGMRGAEFKLLAEIISRSIANCSLQEPMQIEQDRARVLQLCQRFPIY